MIIGFVRECRTIRDERIRNLLRVGEKFADGIVGWSELNEARWWCEDVLKFAKAKVDRDAASLALHTSSRMILRSALLVSREVPDKGRRVYEMMTEVGELRITPELKKLAEIWYQDSWNIDILRGIFDELEYAGNVGITRELCYKGWWVVERLRTAGYAGKR